MVDHMTGAERRTAAKFTWLFILTFPNGGSTALAKLLLTAKNALALTENAEGQWLDTTMSAPGVRWDEAVILDYARIRQIWQDRAIALMEKPTSCQNEYLVIEKSPPNMCRIKSLLSAFGDAETHVVILTRDPFATCASWHARQGREKLSENWGLGLSRADPDHAYFEKLAETWIRRARLLDASRDLAFATIRYEDFAAQPSSVIRRLTGRIPGLSTADPEARIRVKDYPMQRIVDMNPTVLSKLGAAALEAMRRRFAKDADLVASFGY